METAAPIMQEAKLRHPSGEEMALTLCLRGVAGGECVAEERLAWEDGQKGEIPTAALIRLVAGAEEGLYTLRGEWRPHEAPTNAAPALERALGSVEILGPPAASTDRSESRSVVLQLLYEIDCADHPLADALIHNEDYAELEERQREIVRQYVRGVSARRAAFDEILQRYAPDFPLDQLAIVDRNILRLALYEMFHSARPLSVMIHEAVWLADVYGSEGAIGFVNGVLGSVAEELPSLRAGLSPEGVTTA